MPDLSGGRQDVPEVQHDRAVRAWSWPGLGWISGHREPADVDVYFGKVLRTAAKGTRLARAQALKTYFQFIELRHQAEIHQLTGRGIECPIDEMNRPRGQTRAGLRIPPSAQQMERLFAGWREELASCRKFAPTAGLPTTGKNPPTVTYPARSRNECQSDNSGAVDSPLPASTIDRRKAPRMLKSRKPARWVAHLPEPLSAGYRNRVRTLSPRNRNQGVQHLPGPHTRASEPSRYTFRYTRGSEDPGL
jgi:hypothetical protein